MFEMTTEQLTQLGFILITFLAGIVWFVRAYLRQKILDMEADREKQKNEWVAENEKQKNEWSKERNEMNMRIAEIKQDAKREDRLFALLEQQTKILQKHDAHLEENTERVSEYNSQVEILGGQLKQSRDDQTKQLQEMIGSLDTLRTAIDGLGKTIQLFQSTQKKQLEQTDKANGERHSQLIDLVSGVKSTLDTFNDTLDNFGNEIKELSTGNPAGKQDIHTQEISKKVEIK